MHIHVCHRGTSQAGKPYRKWSPQVTIYYYNPKATHEINIVMVGVILCIALGCVLNSDGNQKDLWIGLHRRTGSCSCSQVSDAECDACRASWSWTDGTLMTWWNWLPREPGASSCGRLSADGWAEYECASNYRFICERGNICLLFAQSLVCSRGCLQLKNDPTWWHQLQWFSLRH